MSIFTFGSLSHHISELGIWSQHSVIKDRLRPREHVFIFPLEHGILRVSHHHVTNTTGRRKGQLFLTKLSHNDSVHCSWDEAGVVIGLCIPFLQEKRVLKRRPFKTSINYSLRLGLEESQTGEGTHGWQEI